MKVKSKSKGNRVRLKWRDFVKSKAYSRVSNVLKRQGLVLVVAFDDAEPPEATDVFIASEV